MTRQNLPSKDGQNNKERAINEPGAVVRRRPALAPSYSLLGKN